MDTAEIFPLRYPHFQRWYFFCTSPDSYGFMLESKSDQYEKRLWNKTEFRSNCDSLTNHFNLQFDNLQTCDKFSINIFVKQYQISKGCFIF